MNALLQCNGEKACEGGKKSRFSLLPTMAQMAQGPPQAQKK
jgi:hypothetical protein